jgi:autotransporter adhesin
MSNQQPRFYLSQDWQAASKFKRAIVWSIVSSMFFSMAAPALAAIPEGNMSTGNGALALGQGSLATNHGTAVGTNAATNNNGTAVGDSSFAANNGTAVGSAASATGIDSTAIGSNSSAQGSSSIAIGVGATTAAGGVIANGGIAIGTNAAVQSGQTVAVGIQSKAQNTGDTAVGAMATANSGPVIPGQTAAAAFGTGASATNSAALAVGTLSSSSGVNSASFGTGAAASNDQATALGTFSSAQGPNSSAAGYGARSTAGQSSAFGSNSTAAGSNSLAAGYGSTAGSDSNANATAIGFSSSATGASSTVLGANSFSSVSKGVALGAGASVSNANSVALGADALTQAGVAVNDITIRGTTYGLAGSALMVGTVSVGNAFQTRQIQGVAPGRVNASSTDALNGSQGYALQQAINGITSAGGSLPYVKFNSTKLDAQATGQDSSAVGPFATAMGNNGSAFGSEAGAFGLNGTALGARALAGPANTTAIGFSAAATEINSVALGAGSTTQAAIANPGMTIRGNAYTWAGDIPAGAFSVGSVGSERQVQNVAAGSRDTDAVNMGQYKALASAVEDIQEGGAGTPYDDKYVQFNSTLAKAEATGTDSSAVGPNAIASGNNSSAFGAQAQATADNTVALGKGAQATVANSVALGNGSTTENFVANAGTTIRGTAYAYEGINPAGVVSVGSPGAERQITNVAAGSKSTDAVNYSQLQAVQQSVEGLNITGGGGGPTTVVNNYNNVVNNQAPYFNANSSGADSKAVGNESVAVGGNAVATGDRSISIGENSSTTGVSAVALGYGASATAKGSVALGNGTVASRDNEVNVGGRTVGGVADAQLRSDAVNLGQMQAGDAAAVGQANSYTDARSTQTLNQANSYTDQQFNRAKGLAYSAAAIGMASSSIVMAPDAEQAMGVGVANVNGKSALAVRYSWRSTKDRRTTYNITGATAQGMTGIAAGINWQW